MAEEKSIILRDKMNQLDELSESSHTNHSHIPAPFRGVVSAFDEFGQKLWEEENQVVLGGSLFTLQKIFGIEPKLKIDTLNDIMGINSDDPITDPKETFVCLFGVGCGGAGDTPKSVLDVKYQEREIFDMIPLRVPEVDLKDDEKTKYFFKKELPEGRTAYYLKTFETMPEMNVLWKDGVDDEDGTIVQEGVHNSTRTEPIEAFVEMHLRITEKDIREYFELNGNIDEARINSIGLFTGTLVKLPDNTYDFKDVRLFSKFNLPNEHFSLKKSMNLYYRIYTS